ncbi:DNA helicase B [Elysia marginata]|uniref:DNA helicase B n=1 Tax=Elysia marginata TaxID=1093978 RepID=A0AAV4HI61_9GAST|nr:DNA helicase B [Elysia marginata]
MPGKAARLLGCKAGLTSATLHSVLFSWQAYVTQRPEGDWKYAAVEILVVDECSLVSTRLFANVAKILLENANLRKIVLLGDIRQLPSIEPGDFLIDMFKTLGRVGAQMGCRNRLSQLASGPELELGMFNLAVELSHNHRSESELIVANSELISCMKVPRFNSSRNFHFIEAPLKRGDNGRDEVIRHLLQTSPDLQSHVHSQFVAFRNDHCKAVNELCCQFYNDHPMMKSGSKGKFDFRVGDKICLTQNNLVPSVHAVYLDKYKEEFPELAEALNEEECRLKEKRRKKSESENCGEGESSKADVGDQNASGENKVGLDASGVLDLLDQDDATFDTTIAEMKEKEREDNRLREERIERARQQQKQWKTKSAKKTKPTNAVISSLGKASEKLCNGEVFFIMDEFDHFEEQKLSRSQSGAQLPTRYLLMSDRDPDMPRVVCVPFNDLRKLCKMRHSWARTIHTYQGSESGTVVYVLGAAVPQTWQHVYTAVTRGRKAVYILGDWQQLHAAVTRRDPARRTRLSYRLRESLRDQAASVEMCCQEFRTRQKLYWDVAKGSGDRTRPVSSDLTEDEFGSDDYWLVQVTSQQEKALAGEALSPTLDDTNSMAHEKPEGTSRETAATSPQGDACAPTTIKSNLLNEPDEERKEDCGNSSVFKVDEATRDSECGRKWCYISSDTDSEDEEEEESIFAPLQRYREKKNREMSLQNEAASEIVAEEYKESESEDSDSILVTQTQFIEENVDAVQSADDEGLFQDDDFLLIEAVSKQDGLGQKVMSVNPSLTESDCPLEMRGQQSSHAGKDNSPLMMNHQVVHGSSNPSNSSASASGRLVSPSRSAGSLAPITPPRPSSSKLPQVNGTHSCLKTPPKPSLQARHQTVTMPGNKDFSPSIPDHGLRTPVKRPLEEREQASYNDPSEINGEVSPVKLQRTTNVVGSPFLLSFSESLTFDTETESWGTGSSHSDRDQGESPFPVKRKL